MEQFVWLMDQWRVLAEWRSASMECGEQRVAVAGLRPESFADNWATMSTQEEVGEKVAVGDVADNRCVADNGCN